MNNVDHDPDVADRDEYGNVTAKPICPLKCNPDEISISQCPPDCDERDWK